MQAKYRIGLLIALVLTILGIGYSMYSRTVEQELWGYRPLFLFLAGWALVHLLRSRNYSRQENGWRWLGFSTLSGVLLWLGFPVMPFTPLMFVGFVPLLLVEHEISKAGTKGLFKYAYNTFVIWNILTTYWVANTAFIAGIIAIWLNALFMTVPFLVFHLTKKHTPKVAYLAFIAYWLSFEYLHLNWEISWTWLTLGNSLAMYPSWAQWYEYTGALGGSLWILVLNFLAFQAVQFFRDGEKRSVLQFSVGFATVSLLPILLSVWMYYNYTEKGRSVEAVVIQPNYEPHYQKFEVTEQEQLAHFLQLSSNAITDSTAYLVFPETVFGYAEVEMLGREEISQALVNFVNRYPRLHLVTGYATYHVLTADEPHGRAVRESQGRGGETTYFETYNAAIQISSGEGTIQHYKKSKLVPGAEFLPYPQVFFFAKPIVDMLEGTVGGYGMQKERSVFTSDVAKIAPVICYESVFGDYLTGYIRNGAEAIFIMTNDGWWDNTAGHKQHLRFASLRAIETRRSIARSANTGISAFLNQRGDILQATKYEEAAAIRGSIRLNEERTFYTIWGDMTGRLAVFTTLLLVLNMFVRSRTGK